MIKVKFDNRYENPVCIALGYFDSVHCGHREILRQTKECAIERAVKSAVFTFDNNMNGVFDKNEKQVYTFNERIALLEAIGIGAVVYASFDASLKSMSADIFLEKLFSSLNIIKVFCGYDYRFGAYGKGNAKLLKEHCLACNIECETVPKIEYDGKRVSTTSIKQLLSIGDLERANKLLATPFSISGTVVHGRDVGHKYNIPTANINPSSDKLLPACGVYGTYVTVDGVHYKAVTNVGSKPTFNEHDMSVESMLIDFDGTLYGKEIKIDFIKKLRDIKKFATPSELSEQIHRDIDWRHEC